MDFPTQTPIPFRASEIVLLPTLKTGVFGIFNDSKCIYIDYAFDLKSKLLEIANQQHTRAAEIFSHEPQYILIDSVPVFNMVEATSEYYQHYKPLCNGNVHFRQEI